MILRRVWLVDFRNYETAELEPSGNGLTVIIGNNGDGKTNLLEAVDYLATLSSFRGVGADALVRQGCEQAVIRGEVENAGRTSVVEVELHAQGRDRVLVNHQPLRRARDLLGTFRTTVFSPDDLVLVKGGPAERRRYLDQTLAMLHPRNDALCSEVERVLRQRNSLLRQSAGRHLEPSLLSTLDVWDARLAQAGTALAAARQDLVLALEPEVGKAYDQLASTNGEASVFYQRSWQGTLSDALGAAREQDLRRGMTTVGPHRDELALGLGTVRPARSQASQGEQRCLALALRLAAHSLVRESTGSTPVLLLDDVFSELDAARSEALLAHLPTGQALLTTTGDIPSGARAERTVKVRAGRITGG